MNPIVEGEPNILGLANVLLQRWRTVVFVPLLCSAITFFGTFLVPPSFTATTTFVPELGSRGRLPSGLASLAGQFGLSIGADPGQSPRFYAQVAKSRELLQQVLLAEYENPGSREGVVDSATLLQILKVQGTSRRDSLYRGVRELGKLVSVSVDNQTNIVTLSVESRHAVLAAAVTNRLVEYLNAFNTGTRQSQARERRRFVESRVSEAERELQFAEERLKSFYELNRSWQQAPQLVFEEGRLRRQVEIRQELYLTLRREYETARIEEVNDTPVITVIDMAVPPQRKSKPKRALLTIIAFVFGGMFGLALAFSSDYLERIRREDRELYEDFSTLMRGVRDEVGQAIRGAFRRKSRT
jgi:uncharacterized protein involved in exopolysaccharide biosynthesis